MCLVTSMIVEYVGSTFALTGNDTKEVWNSLECRNQFFDCLGYVAFFRVRCNCVV